MDGSVCCTDIHDAQMIRPYDFGNPLTFPLLTHEVDFIKYIKTTMS